MQELDTICHMITAPGMAAVGIVRLSGPESLSIAQALYRGKANLKEAETHRIYYGHVTDGHDDIDEALFMVMRAPRSYTGEDVVEIQSHGGYVAVQEVLALALKQGARLAEAGEFTRRAFLNGKLDLAQAEAVQDLVEAPSKMALQEALARKKGGLSRAIDALADEILDLTAYLQADIDYPEDDIDRLSDGEEVARAEKIITEINEMIAQGEALSVYQKGVRVAIAGKPNVGKSSLLNGILGHERAIVTDIPGTTRDVVSETVSIHGLAIELLDTAGIRETPDAVEQIGVDLATETLQKADIIIYMYEPEAGLTPADKEIIAGLPQAQLLFVRNKKDLAQTPLERDAVMGEAPLLEAAVRQDDGVQEIMEAVFHLAVGAKTPHIDGAAAINARQKGLLEEAKKALESYIESLEIGMSQDIRIIDLMDALDALGRLTGRNASADLLDHIFSEFCLGK